VVWWAIKCWLPYAQFGLWSLRNPGLSFKQFYAECAANSLAINKSHASLGPNLRPGRIASARRTFERLLTYGIRRDDTVVDYGCGTLRLGALFIEYLETDRYIGLDIDQRILAAGRGQLADDIVETKRPILEVISKESLARVAARKPRWVCSKGVLQHVPRRAGRVFCGPLSSHPCRGHRPAVFAYRARKQTNVAQDLGT
jgi:SAM-dependent methyltransferase